MDNIDKNTTSNFDAPSWSTLIDEAATEQNHYPNVRIINQSFVRLLFFFRSISQMKRMMEVMMMIIDVGNLFFVL